MTRLEPVRARRGACTRPVGHRAARRALVHAGNPRPGRWAGSSTSTRAGAGPDQLLLSFFGESDWPSSTLITLVF